MLDLNLNTGTRWEILKCHVTFSCCSVTLRTFFVRSSPHPRPDSPNLTVGSCPSAQPSLGRFSLSGGEFPAAGEGAAGCFEAAKPRCSLTIASEGEGGGGPPHSALCRGAAHGTRVIPNIPRLYLGQVQVSRCLGNEAPAIFLKVQGVIVEDPRVGQAWKTRDTRHSSLPAEPAPRRGRHEERGSCRENHWGCTN